MELSKITRALLGLALLACSDPSSPAAKERSPQAAVVIDAAITFDPQSFCAEVLPLAEVRRIVGFEVEPVALPALVGARPARMECAFASREDPSMRLTLWVDCRKASSPAEQRKLLAAMVSEGDEYKEVEIGGGGARLYHQRFGSRFMAYSHERLPCTVVLEMENFVEDQLDALAAAVQKRLTSQNRPRPAKEHP